MKTFQLVIVFLFCFGIANAQDLSITCPADVIIACDEPTDPGNLGTAVVTGGCNDHPTVSFTDSETPGDCENERTIIRTWTFVDACGNESSCKQKITVVDKTPPKAPSPPQDLSLECAADVPPSVDLTAEDNCGEKITVSPTEYITPGACANDFVLKRIWTFVDACGNASSCKQKITVVDKTPPKAPSPPQDLSLECAADVPPSVDLTAEDNCGEKITVSPTEYITPGACANDFVLKRIWTFVDACGNASSCKQKITVVDKTPPKAPSPPQDLSLECAADVPPSVDLTAEDNCGEKITVSPTEYITPGACANDFVMVRTWTFVDACGNTSTSQQTITVLDNTPPVITCPEDVTLKCDSDTSPAFTGTAIATDNCDSDPIITFDDIGDDGDCDSMMIITRTWIATDACGNTNSCMQTISLIDSTTTGVYSDLARINQENSVKIYPNPVENSIYVELIVKQSSQITIDLLDMAGRITEVLFVGNIEPGIKNHFELTLDSEPSPGFYMLIIRNRDGEYLGREIILKK